MASSWYQEGMFEQAKGNLAWDTDATIKKILVKDAYVFSKTHTVTDIAAQEVDVTGYVGGFGGAGRRVLQTPSVVDVPASDRVEYRCGAETWTALAAGNTIGGCVYIREQGGSDANSKAIAFDDLLQDKATNGDDVTHNPDATGALRARRV